MLTLERRPVIAAAGERLVHVFLRDGIAVLRAVGLTGAELGVDGGMGLELA